MSKDKKKTGRDHQLTSKKENIELEISFYESLLKQDPHFIEALGALAEDYTKVGRIEEGLNLDLKLSQLLPEDAIVHYNLACSLSLLNRINEASEALKKAVVLGYSDFDHLEKDPDLSNLKSHPTYKEFKEKTLKPRICDGREDLDTPP